MSFRNLLLIAFVIVAASIAYNTFAKVTVKTLPAKQKTDVLVIHGVSYNSDNTQTFSLNACGTEIDVTASNAEVEGKSDSIAAALRAAVNAACR